MQLKGQRVVITGAASGLGRRLALDLATEQARLVLGDVNADLLDSTVEECRQAGAEVVAATVDVTREADCRKLVEQARESFDGIDVLILCAGISMWARFEAIKDLTVFRRLMDINYLGVVHCVHAALPLLKLSRGLVVTISSTQAVIGLPNHTGYSASKHAVNGFLEALEHELQEQIRILNVMPGWIRGTNLRASAITGDGTVRGSDRKHGSDAVGVEDASLAILQAVRSGKRELYLPSKLRFVPWVKLIAPGWLRKKIRKAVHRQE